MRATFEHLLGLPAAAAVAILNASGIMDVEVVPTAAPPRAHADAREGYAETRVVSVADDGRRLVVSRFLVGDPKPKGEP